MSNPLEIVTLKNGGEAPLASVQAVMVSLNGVMRHGLPGLLAVADLHSYVKSGKVVPGMSTDILIQHGLMDSDGRVHEILSDVILSAAQGEGLSFALGSPYAVASD